MALARWKSENEESSLKEGHGAVEKTGM